MSEESMFRAQAADQHDVARYLAEEAAAAATSMRGYGDAQQDELRPLHELQWWCDRVLTHTPPVGDTVVPLYLMSRMLDDALDNLTGDFYYDETSHALRQRFFVDLSGQLGDLGHYGFDEPTAWIPVITRAIDAYLRVVHDLNLHAESHVPVVSEEDQ